MVFDRNREGERDKRAGSTRSDAGALERKMSQSAWGSFWGS
jgi:hypothetical protein